MKSNTITSHPAVDGLAAVRGGRESGRVVVEVAVAARPRRDGAVADVVEREHRAELEVAPVARVGEALGDLCRSFVFDAPYRATSIRAPS